MRKPSRSVVVAGAILATPAIDRFFEKAAIERIIFPGLGERGAAAAGPALLIEIIKGDPHRHGDTFPDDDGLPVMQCRQRREKTACALRHRLLYEVLIAVIGQAKSEDRVALGENGGRQLRRPLADQT